MDSSFPNRWSFSYLKFTKYVTYIIAEPKYKYGQQEQVTVRNYNRSTVLERSVLKCRGGEGLNPVLQPCPQFLSLSKPYSCSVRVKIFYLINGWSRETNKTQINAIMKQSLGLDRNVLRPTPGDPLGVEQGPLIVQKKYNVYISGRLHA